MRTQTLNIQARPMAKSRVELHEQQSLEQGIDVESGADRNGSKSDAEALADHY
jgi:hypothetical protein